MHHAPDTQPSEWWYQNIMDNSRYTVSLDDGADIFSTVPSWHTNYNYVSHMYNIFVKRFNGLIGESAFRLQRNNTTTIAFRSEGEG